MDIEIFHSLAAIFLAGIVAQWLSWRVKLPSILLLIIFGFLLGPWTGFLNIDMILGDLLVPLVSLAIAIILFEGGLTLDMADLAKIGKEVRNLLTIGILTTFILVTIAAKFFLKFDWSLSILLSSILIVTGPTVVIPLLRHIRPTGKVGSILRWEGIVIDPIGVMIAVLTFEVILLENPFHVPSITILTIAKTAVIGFGIGYLSSWIFKKLLLAEQVPDFLQNPFALSLVIVAFIVSNLLQHESGLLTVTVMGIFLASQKSVSIEKIVEFKENLQVLIISMLFIILTSRLQLTDLAYFNKGTLYFVGALVLVIRPVSVIFSTWNSPLSWREKVFLMWMAPRGIIAAVMASVFAIQLINLGRPEAAQLVPTVFMVIFATVGIYGITGAPLAYLLKLASPNPQGVLIIGAHSWAIEIANILKSFKIKVVIVDTNAVNVYQAKNQDIAAYQVNILAENVIEEIDLDGIGKLLAITSNGEVNTMATLRFSSIFGKGKVFQLSTEHRHTRGKKELTENLRGRILFSSGMTFDFISEEIDKGAEIKVKKIDSEADRQAHMMPTTLEIPLFTINSSGGLETFAMDNAPTVKSGSHLIYLDCTKSRRDEILKRLPQKETIDV